MTGSSSAWHPGPAWLFCPADRPERYAKALDSADIAIFDLEDAVAPAARAAARSSLVEGLRHVDPDRFVVRVNSSAAPDHDDDLRTVRTLGARAMLAKCDGPEDLDGLEGVPTIALIESAIGVVRVGEIAMSAAVVGLMWGADDLVASMGGTASRRAGGAYRDAARLARATVLLAAKAAGILAVDNVVMAIDDEAQLQREVEDAAASGFDAKAAIHPRQVKTIRDEYTPAAEQLAWADRVLEAAAHEQGVFRLDDRMVDGPIVKQALGLRARHERIVGNP